MIKKSAPVIGVTMGDPSGIGPEIILKSYGKRGTGKGSIIVIGDWSVMVAAHDMLKITSFRLNRVHKVNECLFNREVLHVLDINLLKPGGFYHGKVQAVAGNAAFQCIKKA